MKNKIIIPTIALVVCIGIIVLIQRFNSEDKNILRELNGTVQKHKQTHSIYQG